MPKLIGIIMLVMGLFIVGSGYEVIGVLLAIVGLIVTWKGESK